MKQNRNIGIMYAISLLEGMVFYGAIATLYRQAIGVSVFQITIIESISLALALLLELPWGIVAEKIGYKNTMIVCSVLYFISKIIFWQANGFLMLLLERILLAVVISGISGVDESILYLSSDKDKIHKVFSIYDSLSTLGLIIANSMYVILWRGDYKMAGLATVVTYGMMMVLSFFLKEVKPEKTKEGQAFRDFTSVLKEVVHRKEVFFFIIGIALFKECNQTITIFLNQLQYVRAGMSESMIGWAYIGVTILGLLGVKSASFAEHFGKKKAGVMLFSCAGVACIVLALTANPVLSVLSIVCIRVTFCMIQPLSQTIQNRMILHKNRATALSINSLIMDGVAISTSLAFGKVSDLYLPAAFGLGSGFCILGLFLFLWSMKKMKIAD